MTGTRNKVSRALPRGGRRPGAGRPRLGEKKLVDTGVRLRRETIQFYKDEAEDRGMTTSERMREVLERYAKRARTRRK